MAELFQSILGNSEPTDCQWTLPAENVVAAQPGSQFWVNRVTGFGFCAANVETCIHLGAIPRPVYPTGGGAGGGGGIYGVNCSACCAYSPCVDYNGGQDSAAAVANGYCLLPKLQPFNTTVAPPNATTISDAAFTGVAMPGDLTPTDAGYVYDEAERACLTIGGRLGYSNVSWWAGQCPMSGRCCLYPKANQCESCGRKYGKSWNWR